MGGRRLSLLVSGPKVCSLAVAGVGCQIRGVFLAMMSVLTMDPAYWLAMMSCWRDEILYARQCRY